MTVISNKTRGPLSVPLPRGKTLHLGPGKTGQISSTAISHPAVRKLVDAGQIEIVGEGARPAGHPGSDERGRPWTPAHRPGSTIRGSGDR